MSDLPKRLRIKASMIALGERIARGSDTALMEEAADVIEALSASVENHQLHMLGMARDRDQLRAMLTAQPQASAAQSAQAGAVADGSLPWTNEQLARAWYLAEYGPGHDLAPGYAVTFARELAAMLAAAPAQPAAQGQGEVQRLRELVNEAFEFINKSGEHDSACEVFDLDDGDRHKECNCGLDAIIRKLYAALAAHDKQSGGEA